MRFRFALALIVVVSPHMWAAPTTGPAAAAPWLLRVERDIAALPAQTPQEMAVFQPGSFALWLYQVAPTPQRRESAMRYLDAACRTEIDKRQSDEQVRSAYIADAYFHAMLNDPDVAKQLLKKAEAPTGTRPTTDQNVSWGVNFMQSQMQGAALLRLKDEAGFERLNMDEIQSDLVASDLARWGFKEEADKAYGWAARQRSFAATAPSQSPFHDPQVEQLDLVRAYIHSGELTKASAEAARLREMDRKADTVWSGSAYVDLAKAFAKASDHDRYIATRDAFVSLGGKSYRQDEQDMLGVCVHAHDPTGFNAIADIYCEQLEPLARGGPRDQLDYANEMARLAPLFYRMGHADKCRWAIGNAERAMQRLERDAQATDIKPAERAQAYVWIACAWATVDDTAGVARNKAAALRSAKLGDMEWDNMWDDVVDAYADNGHFADAKAAIRDVHADTYGILRANIANRQGQFGWFSAAWQTVAAIPDAKRPITIYNLVVQEVQAGQLDGLAPRIDALASAYDRAAADLAASATLLGRQSVGNLETFLSKDW
jgi:hypothetical protein